MFGAPFDFETSIYRVASSQERAAMKKTITPAGELLGQRLRDLRQERNVTQVVLSARAGLPQSHISEIESGAMLPNLITIIRIAAALPCKVSDLTSVFDGVDLPSLLPK
jgi:DNA-binding XRE family transcriptional regulator